MLKHNYSFPAITDRWLNIFNLIDSVTATSHHTPSHFETSTKLKNDERKREILKNPTTIAADEEHLLRND